MINSHFSTCQENQYKHVQTKKLIEKNIIWFKTF